MAKNYHHLTLAERTLLETQLTLGMRPAAIAVELDRSRSTITREMARNGGRGLRVGDPARVEGQYRALRHAARRAAGQRARLAAARPQDAPLARLGP